MDQLDSKFRPVNQKETWRPGRYSLGNFSETHLALLKSSKISQGSCLGLRLSRDQVPLILYISKAKDVLYLFAS